MSSRPPKKPINLTLDASLVQDDQPMEVAPKIFIGSIHSAFNLDSLLSNGITHILNASRLPITFPKQFTYLSVDIRDKGESNILSCIPTANIFIESGVDNGGVLIHCFGGKSRSAAFIAAYLMSTMNWTFDMAYSAIKSVRSIIDINAGFECQLKAYALAGYDVYIAQQILLRSRIRNLHSLRGTTLTLFPSESKQSNKETEYDSKLNVHSYPPKVYFCDSVTSMQNVANIVVPNPSIVVEETDNQSALHKRTWGDAKDSGCDTKESVGEMDVDTPHEDKSSVSMGEVTGSVNIGNDTNMRLGSLKMSRNRNNRSSGRLGSKLSNAEVDSKTPSCRLSRPGNNSVRVMPPLRGLEREFKCSWCNSSLFNLANVIRVDIDIGHLLDEFKADEKSTGQPINKSSSSNSHKEDIDQSSDNSDYLSMPPPKNIPRSVRASMILSENDDSDLTTQISPRHNSAVRSNFSHVGGNTDMEMDIEEDHDTSFDPILDSSAPSKFSKPLKTSKAQNSSFKGFDFDIPLIDLASHNLESSSGEKNSSPLSARFAQQSFNDPPASIQTSRGKGLSIDVDKSSSSDSVTIHNNNNSNSGSQPTSSRLLSDSLQSGGNISARSANGNQQQPLSARLHNQTMSYHSDLKSSSNFHSNSLSPKSTSPQQIYGYPQVSSRPSSATSTSLYNPTYAGLQSSINNAAHTFDESPRVVIPPHRLHETGWSPRDRPQSAEKRRWLARVNLLREGDTKVAKMADDDDKASQLAFGRDKYLHIEYLPWMGQEVFNQEKDMGDICCMDCHRVVGSWIWKPSIRLLQDGKFEAPLFIIHKNVVHQSDVQFDATPSSTPRTMIDL